MHLQSIWTAISGNSVHSRNLSASGGRMTSIPSVSGRLVRLQPRGFTDSQLPRERSGNGAESQMDQQEPPIIPRNLRFNLSKHATRHWLRGDVLQSAQIDCFSVFLPLGERYFIRSLKRFAPVVNDAELRHAIQDFCIQEAFHTREHEDYNQGLRALGYDVDGMEALGEGTLNKGFSPLVELATTCAIEHITTSFSTALLRNPALLDTAPAPYRRLWMWHALEEIEHRAVALAVLNAATPSMSAWSRYFFRTTVFSVVIILFVATVTRCVRSYVRTDGVRTGLRFWLRYLWVVLVRPGFLGRLGLISFLRYYWPGYRATARSYDALVLSGRRWLDCEMASDGGTPPTIG